MTSNNILSKSSGMYVCLDQLLQKKKKSTQLIVYIFHSVFQTFLSCGELEVRGLQPDTH